MLQNCRLARRPVPKARTGEKATVATYVEEKAVGGVSKDSSKSSAVGGSVDQDALKVIATNCIEAAKKETLDDGQLLKGRVPQGSDWLECWAESTEQVSFHKQARLRSKKKKGM